MSAKVDRPLPGSTPRMRPFWAAAGQERLTIQRCSQCGKKHFPPVAICSGCLRDTLDWIDASGHGTVFSFVVMHHVYHPYFADKVPYVVASVKLEEGPRIISNVIGCDASDVEIGMGVEVTFERAEPEFALPMFRPSE